jgi:kynurenine formamidase
MEEEIVHRLRPVLEMRNKEERCMIIDLTHVIRHGLPPFPGDRETELVHSRQYAKHQFNNHELTINMHAGTHIDGPMHLLDIQQYISEQPVDTFVGEGFLLDVRGQRLIDYKAEYEELLPEGQIIVIYSGHGAGFGQPDYFDDFPVLTESFVQLLIRKRVKMIGMDTPSPELGSVLLHELLLRSNILIIENMANVDKLLGAGRFELIALPLLIEADSSIARVIARLLPPAP